MRCVDVHRHARIASPTDKIMLSLTAFADELEREKARQRTFDAMLRKAMWRPHGGPHRNVVLEKLHIKIDGEARARAAYRCASI